MGDGAAIEQLTSGSENRGVLAPILARVLSIDASEALSARRGFPRSTATPRLEAAGMAFLGGYNCALRTEVAETIKFLDECPADLRGFAAEGSAMAAALRLALVPWADPLAPLLSALSRHYVHLAHVGVGWAVARVPFARRRLVARLDPMLAPLAIDGAGFHDGYFRPNRIARTGRRPAGSDGHIYDQGIGRSLWFSCAAAPAPIIARIDELGPARRDDLWAGVGLASVYAGGAGPDAVAELEAASGRSRRWFRQGAAFALVAHARARSIPRHASQSAQAICRLSGDAIETLVEQARRTASAGGGAATERYQSWRRLVADDLGGEGES